jgi:hypothetical protein
MRKHRSRWHSTTDLKIVTGKQYPLVALNLAILVDPERNCPVGMALTVIIIAPA